MDYFDFDKYYGGLSEDEEIKNSKYEYRIGANRSRESLADALEFDKKLFNEILNKDNLDKVDKHRLASLALRSMNEFLETTRVNKSFEEFMRNRLGEEKYMQYVTEWLRERNNDFFQRVGMEQMMMPSSIYFMGSKNEED